MDEPSFPQPDFEQDEQSELAIRSVSRAVSIDPEKLLILDVSEATLPNSGARYSFYKILNTETGESQRFALEGAKKVDYLELLEMERSLEFEKLGRLQPELHRLVELGEERTIPVLIKVAIPEEVIDKSTMDDPIMLKEGIEYAQAEQERVIRRAASLFRETMRGFNLAVPRRPRQSGPFISAVLSPDAIRSLGRDERIAFIGLDQEKVMLDYPSIPESLPSTRTDFVHNNGFRGSGVKIAVLENGDLALNDSCFNIAARQVTETADWHFTKSVGIIGNRHDIYSDYWSDDVCSGSWQGYAPEASVYLANNSDYKNAYEWAKSNGVNVITMSWHHPSEETSGSLHSRDVYFDYWVVRYPYPTIFTSAGNQAPDAYASGKGYNFFGVGNVLNDGDGDRCNDLISSDSSYKDPTTTHSDREVPEIAAPGSRHELLGTSFGGTSCATPVAASIAALLMSRNNSLLIWPEAIRAILLATANYQYADGANWSKNLEGKDGTGLVNAQYGMWTAGRRESSTTAQFRAHDYGTMSAGDFVGGFFIKTWQVFTGTTNSRIRVAITWNSKTTASGGEPVSSILDADLDLWIYDPDMNLVALSQTWDSNYEFVEFTPAKPGAYTIKIRGYDVPSGFWSYYGVAWTTHYDICRL